MAIAKLLCSALSKARYIPKGVKLDPSTMRLNTTCMDCISSGKRDLFRLGFNKADAEMLLRTDIPKDELLDTVRTWDNWGVRADLLADLRQEEQEFIDIFGCLVDSGKKNKLVWDHDALSQDVMTLTRKHRAEIKFKKGACVCEELPESLRMTPEDRASKAILDRGFDNVPGTEYAMMQYRGEVIPGTEPYVKEILAAKKGDVFEIPGYAWTTDSKKYAFGSYSGDGVASDSKDWFEMLNKYSIKYHILCPPETKIMASRSRMGQEFVLPCDSKMRLLKKNVDESGRFIEIFCEHIPKKSINQIS